MFKALIVIHLMIREGVLDATLQYLADNPRRIAINGLSDCEPKTLVHGGCFIPWADSSTQCRCRDITFDDILITSLRVPKPSRTPKRTTFEVDQAG